MHSDLFHALGRLVWASHVASAFPKYKHKRLNEMLVLGYVEGMDMGVSILHTNPYSLTGLFNKESCSIMTMETT